MTDIQAIQWSQDAERLVLAALLTFPEDTVPEVSGILDRADFFVDRHRVLFDAILAVYDAKNACDPLLVREHLERANLLEAAGGRALIDDLAGVMAPPSSTAYHAEIVKERSIIRRIREVAIELERRTSTQIEDPKTLIDEAESMIYAIGARTVQGEAVSVDELCQRAMERMAMPEDQLKSASILTQYADIDKILGGFKPGQLIVVAGRPGMGKTTFAMNCVDRMTAAGFGALFYSLEMTDDELFTNMLCCIAQIPRECIETRRMTEDQARRYDRACESIYDRSLWFDHNAPLTSMTLRSKARRHAGKNRVDVVLVDYLQLMSASGKSENRQQEIATISRGLKTLARELNVVVVAMSQLNRAVESRDDKRPKMSDLRESGAIEQDADVVLLLHREDYYNRTAENEGLADVIIAKHRNGDTGTVRLRYRKEVMRFESYTPATEPFYG